MIMTKRTKRPVGACYRALTTRQLQIGLLTLGLLFSGCGGQVREMDDVGSPLPSDKRPLLAETPHTIVETGEEGTKELPTSFIERAAMENERDLPLWALAIDSGFDIWQLYLTPDQPRHLERDKGRPVCRKP